MAVGFCFVIMPFREEVHYMYLYLEQHLKRHHNLDCRRGSSYYDQDGIPEKIRKSVDQADVIIAECTGGNPNVYYELGLAHGLDKRVILITRDEPEKTPTDVRSFEFIRYTLDGHTSFLAQLDAALRDVLGSYDAHYAAARALFLEFCRDKNQPLEEAAKADFVRQAAAKDRVRPLPDPGNRRAIARYLMPAIAATWDMDLNDLARAWLDEAYPE